MEIIDELKRLISKQQELLEIAEVQLLHGYSKGWYKEKKTCEGKIKFFKRLLVMAQVDEETARKVPNAKITKLDFNVPDSPRLFCSNYRVMLLLNKKTDYIDGFFWTPELTLDNSHRALWNIALWKELDSEGHPGYDIFHRWAGFYMYGLGNIDQKQLVLYGESCDYPHTEVSNDVKECFLKGMKFSDYLKTKQK